MNDTPAIADEPPPAPLPPRLLMPLALLFEGGLGVMAWLLGLVFGPPALKDFQWDVRDALTGVAATVPMLAAFLACVRWPVGPLARIKQISVDFIAPLFAGCTLGELALISTAAGLGEELLFRGF